MKQVSDLDLHTQAIWGLKNLAKFMGCSVDRVRTMAKDPTCPISRPGGQWFALKDELWAWMRLKPSKAA